MLKDVSQHNLFYIEVSHSFNLENCNPNSYNFIIIINKFSWHLKSL